VAKRALVTGANGFVGSHLTDLLLERGWAVRCLVRRTSNLRWLPTERVELHHGEVTDPESLEGAVRGVDVVFHGAGITHAPNEAEYRRVNAEGTRNLVRQTNLESPSLDRFVLVSSLAAGGPTSRDAARRESDPDQPIGAYGRSKQGGEIELTREAGDLPWTILRPPGVYGTRDEGFLVLARLISRGWVTRFSGKAQKTNVIHVSDLVRGLLDAALSPSTVGRTYYVAHSRQWDFRAIGLEMAATIGVRPRTLFVPLGLVPAIGWSAGVLTRLTGTPNPLSSDRIRDLMAPAWTCDSSLAEQEFGFRAEIDLPDGMPEVMQWYRKEGWI
jgi:dihydroflavonol-4-reductase